MDIPRRSSETDRRRSFIRGSEGVQRSCCPFKERRTATFLKRGNPIACVRQTFIQANVWEVATIEHPSFRKATEHKGAILFNGAFPKINRGHREFKEYVGIRFCDHERLHQEVAASVR